VRARRAARPDISSNCGLLKGRTSPEEPEIGCLIAEGYRGQGLVRQPYFVIMAEAGGNRAATA